MKTKSYCNPPHKLNVAPLRKDHVECLVKAAEILKENNVLFLIVGNTSLDREYENKVMEKQRNMKVKFTGFALGI